ncbi:hypothetical protein DXX99_10870 [Ammonifex thiophilus]|uniref:Uncharacterized protein n=1 Tax=Ammonifex thiophilus TaxID=444093 RepID=A0A3D8P0N6_9THEO|nr:hypothetical protein DXX99_10870 [Ammonifex thiophilus]
MHQGVIPLLDKVIKEAESLLGMSTENVLREGLKKLLSSKVEENNEVIENLRKKYGVSNYQELEEKIREGELPGHPAWEDVILWEELSRHNEALRRLIRQLEAGRVVS